MSRAWLEPRKYECALAPLLLKDAAQRLATMPGDLHYGPICRQTSPSGAVIRPDQVDMAR